MKPSLVSLLALVAGCTVVVRPPAEPRREPPPQERPPEQQPPPVTVVILEVPPGHLPDPGECRLWYPGTPPGRQPRPRSRPCEGLAEIAPAGSWIVYRPDYDRRLAYVRVVDERRPGIVIRVRIFDLETYRLVREELPQEQRPPVQPPTVQPPPVQPPPAQPPPAQPPPTPPPPPPLSPLFRAAPLAVPTEQLPDLGECRLWIPSAPLIQEPLPRSRSCQGIAAIAPPRTWIVYRPSDNGRLAYIGVEDERRAGVLIRILVYDLATTHLVRDELPQADWPPVQPPRVERPPIQPPVQPPPVQPPPAQPPPVQPPPVQPPPAQPPPVQPPPVQPPPAQPPPAQPPPVQPPPAQPPPAQPPPVQPPPAQPPPAQPPPAQPPPAQPPPPPVTAATLNVPPGHLPELGECRVWIPGVPPGLQSRPKSRSCDGIVASARAGSWILYRPANEPKVVYVRIIDERRAGIVVRVQVFDIQSKRLVREESP